jgi:hypothetical protein
MHREGFDRGAGHLPARADASGYLFAPGQFFQQAVQIDDVFQPQCPYSVFCSGKHDVPGNRTAIMVSTHVSEVADENLSKIVPEEAGAQHRHQIVQSIRARRDMIRNTSLAVLIVLTALAALAQGQEVRPAYEVATIKLNDSDKGSRGSQEDKAQAVFTSIPLKCLIQWAYKVYPFQVSGSGWLEDVHFDISAKYPRDLRDEERPLMLRTLLEDRIKLVIHRESREMQGYALVIAKGGFKLKTVEPGRPSRAASDRCPQVSICKEGSADPYWLRKRRRWLPWPT